MAIHTQHATTRSPRYALGHGDVPIARLVLLLLLVVGIGAALAINTLADAEPSDAARQIASFNPRAVFTDNTPHFLPTPVAALAPETGAGPPAPAAGETAGQATERVKVANTGGVGAILRAEPPRGRQIAGLRDGQVLQVLEHQDEWLRVRTESGAEGWIFGRLVAPEN
jgi:hypothetical protein